MPDEIDLLQSLRSPALDSFFLGVTQLGSAPVVTILAFLAYWCWRRTTGLRLLILVTITSRVVEAMKTGMAIPRPDSARVIGTAVTDPGFPSGHAQRTAALWAGAVAELPPKRLLAAVGISAIVLVDVSRVYLALHVGIDVVAGSLIGILGAVILAGAGNRIGGLLHRAGSAGRLALALLVAGLGLLILPAADTPAIAGFLVGIASGYELERRYVRFEDACGPRRRLVRGILGVLLVGAAAVAPGQVLPVEGVWAFGQSVLVGIVGIAVVPAIFTRLEPSPARGTASRRSRSRRAPDSEE